VTLTSGLILAAGAGSRFERPPKQLAEFKGQPLLDWALEAHSEVYELHRIVVVLGARAAEIRAGISLGRAEPVVCHEWANGLSASLKAGMEALRDSDAVIVTLGDQPFVTSEVIRRFVGVPVGTRAIYHGRPGHPVVLSGQYPEMIERLGGDQGAGRLLSDTQLMECGQMSPHAGLDIDTVADLHQLQRLE
jgi:CTP:molybdopterin cytidylyltransferase MocA